MIFLVGSRAELIAGYHKVINFNFEVHVKPAMILLWYHTDPSKSTCVEYILSEKEKITAAMLKIFRFSLPCFHQVSSAESQTGGCLLKE